MALEKITSIAGTGVYVPGSDIDTDRIIPARFMKCVTFDGLGEYLFYDVRKNEDGSEKAHPLNDPQFAGATILLSGSNFGCGSSREHAPQALYRWGFRGVIAESFAEIFFGNCTTLGIPCAAAAGADIRKLAAAVKADPAIEVTIDVENRTVRFGDQSFPFDMPESAHEALLNARWDPIQSLIEGEEDIEKTAASLGYMGAA
jgi:3-isopropylmalate/(R)-2-methylmalate dehydratase small subunit